MLAGFGIVIGVIDRVALYARPLESLTWRRGIFLGLSAIARLDSRRFPIGCDHRGRTSARIQAGGGSQVLLPAGHTSRSQFRPVQACADISSDPVPPAWGPIALATVISFIGYAVIAWLLRYVSTHTFMPFVIYRCALAALVVVLLITDVLSPLPPS